MIMNVMMMVMMVTIVMMFLCAAKQLTFDSERKRLLLWLTLKKAVKQKSQPLFDRSLTKG